jgi:type IV pilus assembly protein PilY1
MSKSFRSVSARCLHSIFLACALTVLGGGTASAQTLSDNPLFSNSNVPANLMMALSVEFPTGTVAAYNSAKGYSSSNTYLGYFDPAKCYSYSSSSPPDSATAGYFTPQFTVTVGASCKKSTTTTDKHGNPVTTYTYYWSGNFLNWATMTALDEFRQAMTGGNRIVDTTSKTVLLRSNLNSQSTTGNFADRTIDGTNASPSDVIGDSTYASQSTAYLHSATKGSQFVISDSAGDKTTYNVEVQVCVTGMLESNCNSAHASTDYPGAGTYAKPEGLIQQNYKRIRVGAAAYGYQSGSGAANGVIRALIRDNGPTTYNGYGTRQTNSYAEWDATTGIFATNPDSDEVTGTAPGKGNATQSGAINYLNQFGYTNGYETYDTIADLYWAALSYYMNVSLDSSYYSDLSSSNSLDTTFPVLTGSALDDPIKYSCQSNAIVTIGDSHTWYDTRVPSTSPDPSNAQSPLATITQNGVTVDAAAFVTKLGNLPLIEKNGSTAASITMAQLRAFGSSAKTSSGAGTALGTQYEPNGTTHSTYNMAGLAYYAHTNDIRGDTRLPNAQTVDTYTVDVLEPGPYDSTSGNEIDNPSKFSTGSGNAGPNMYWLAAKYGGFNNLNNDGVPANILTWHTNASSGTGLYPDNYFPGNRPDLLQKGLGQIFNKVASTAAQTGTAPSVGSSRSLLPVSASTVPYSSSVAGFPVYTTQYAPVTWVGDVWGFVAANDSSTTVTPATNSPSWHAQTQLDTLTQTAAGSTFGWDTGRRIITWNGTKAVPFRYTTLSSTEQTAINSASNGQSLLNYLRGDKSNEGTLFRVRSHILGDIVNSAPVLVQGASSIAYSDIYNPGYSAFSSSVKNRTPVVYVGANDGMLHAFEADFLAAPTSNPVAGGGSELFAYVPSLLYQGPNNTPLVDGLPALANLNGVSTNNFAHHFYVDRTPQVADVDFAYTSTGSYAPTSGTPNWHTILVGGLGKGGKGIYALDVTSVPTAVDTTNSSTMESSLTTSPTNKVLWEFTETDMGYSYGAPLIVKTRKYGWVVLMTSGYGNTGAGQDGHGILYVINVQTGKLIQKIDTGVGSTSAPAGLAQISAFTQNLADGTVEQVYGGDLLGNVWRFDLSEPAIDSSGTITAGYLAPTKFATLTDSSGAPQPITTAPRIAESVDSTGLGTLRWVFVGTGQFLDTSDLTTTQTQTFYALRDGTGAAPSTTSLPLTRGVLTADTDLTKGLVLSDSSPGWYYDLVGQVSANQGSERVIVNPDTNTGTGTVAWATLIPSSTDPCLLQGNIYATNFSGFTQLLDSSGAPQKYLSPPSAPTSVMISTGQDGTTYLITGQVGTPNPTKNALKGASSSPVPSRINWREILN